MLLTFRLGIFGMVTKINLAQKLTLIEDHWHPRVIAQLNNQHVKLVKFQGEFVWHHHEDADELFFVVKGRLRMDFRDKSEWLEAGEMIVVPRGIEHRPYAEEEVEVMLFEPTGLLNTGNVTDETKTAPLDDWL